MTIPHGEGSRPSGQAADRIAESVARLVLSLAPGGAILAEAVSFARAIHDDADADAARAALDARLGVIGDRLAALERAGAAARITGDRARVLMVAVRYANEHVVGYCDADDTIKELGLTADAYREAAQELGELGVVTTYGNMNHASGFSGVSVSPAVFAELVGQVIPGVVPERELGEILDVFRRAKNPDWVLREDFEALGIPTPRAQHLLQYLEDEGIVELQGPGTAADRLLFLNVRLLSRGRRVLRGDETL